MRYSLLPFFKNHNPSIDDVQFIPDQDAGPPASLDQTMEVHLNDKVKMRTTMKAGSAEPYPLIEGVPPDLGLTVTDAGIMIDAPVTFFDGGVEVGGDKIQLVDELLPVSWFTTIGSLSPDVTTAWRPELPDAQQKADLVDTTLKLDSKHTPSAPAVVDLWIVVRDGRGGTDWTHRQLLLR